MTARLLFIAVMLGGVDAVAAAPNAEEQTTLRGTVVNEDGKPVADAQVFIEWQPDGRADAVTDENGAFELAAPRRSLGGRLIRASADSGRLQAYHQFPWEDDEIKEAEIRLPLAPARRVELHVVDGAGRAIEGAKTGVFGNYCSLETGKTDHDGRVVFLIPQGVDVECLYAISDEHGADYRAYVLERGRSGDKYATAPKLPEGAVELKLEGAKPVRVRVVEADGGPIPGIQVYPWLLKKPGQPEELNLSYFTEQVQATTDSEGYAAFSWIPQWHEGPITLWPRSEEFVHQRGTYDPQTGDGTLLITLNRFVPLRGRVTSPDGSPAAGVRVAASGAGYTLDDFRGTATTDAEGRYELKAAPNMVYLVTASHEQWAAAAHTGFAIFPGKPIENLDFKLRPATRLFGRVTVGPDKEPVEGQRIDVYQYGKDANNMKDVQLPNPEKSNIWVQPLVVYSTSSDENGDFELLVGPGKFDIRGPQQAELQKFEIADEKEREFNFHAARREKGLLRGLVVADDPAAVAGAEIVGIYRYSLAGRDMQATANEAGKFEVERELHRTVIHARSADGKQAGVVEIKPDDKLAVIPISPMARASGRLLDAKSGKPLPDKELVFGIKVYLGDDDAPWRTSFGGKTKTDKKGRFTLEALILDQPYDINLSLYAAGRREPTSWRHVGEVRPDKAEHIELGDLSSDPAK